MKGEWVFVDREGNEIRPGTQADLEYDPLPIMENGEWTERGREVFRTATFGTKVTDKALGAQMEERSMTLTDFLLARIAEDEAWVERESSCLGGVEPWSLFEAGDGFTGGIGVDPRRLAAACEATRRIVEALEADDNRDRYGGCGDDCEWKALEYAAQLLALPYAGHPDFREEWRP